MSSRDFDPFRLDVAAFAKAGAALHGDWPLASLDRLSGSSLAEALPRTGSEVSWSARGEARAMRGGQSQAWVHLTAAVRLPLECQRCLGEVEVPLSVARSFLFVTGEDAAAQLDTDSEDDVLALTPALDLRELVEDELLLALPLVPRHETCPQPLKPAQETESTLEKPNPFAALAVLKRSGPVN